MTAYTVQTNDGVAIEIEADNVAEAIRTLRRTRPSVSVLSIGPSSIARVADQQA